MAKKRDGYLKNVSEQGEIWYSNEPAPLPDWMKDRSKLPKRPPLPVVDVDKST